MKPHHLILPFCLMACATIQPRVDLPQPLPNPPLSNITVLPQHHYVLPKDHNNEIYNLNLLYGKLAEEIDNLHWFYYPEMLVQLSYLMKRSIEKMNDANNEEEFIFYHRIFVQTVDVEQEFDQFRLNEQYKLDDIRWQLSKVAP